MAYITIDAWKKDFEIVKFCANLVNQPPIKEKMLRTFVAQLLLFLIALTCHAGDSWEKVLSDRKGQVLFYWYPNNINIDISKDIIDGVEHDLAFAFIDYLNKKYDISLQARWVETESFDEVLNTVAGESGGIFGASAISITSARQQRFAFTPPYMADIAVLISNASMGIALTPNQFQQIFDAATAITIKNTTLLDGLYELKEKQNIDFKTEFVTNSGELIDKIEDTPDGFGYVDLPNFLIALDNRQGIRRQFFYPIKLEGLAMVYPKNSDWTTPVEDYFTSEQFQEDKHAIILKYFGNEIGEIIDQISRSAEMGPFEEIMISNKEKELQYQELLEAANREKENSDLKNILITALGFVAFGGLFLIVSNRMKTATNKVLKKQQEAIEENNRKLKNLNDEKNDLIKVLAHDLRSPLSNIQGCASMLAEEDLKKENQELVSVINQSSGKIQSMISKILDIDAIESGDRNLTLDAIDLVAVIDEVVEANEPNAHRKGITISREIDSHEPVKADKVYLSQIIENLISNAIKFSKPSSLVKVIVTEMDDLIRIAVADEGPGFTAEDQQMMFKKFQQLNAKPTGGEKSVGLGLSIIKSYTEMLGGKIFFDTEEGVGTTFYVDLVRANSMA
ncbi:MAG: hypothetical protein Tsb0034_00580 [Ekhidna sp.]